LLQALADQGYTTPTPIQAQAIPPLLTGRDLLGIAQTGTGKTAAFTLPILQRLAEAPAKLRPGEPRALILTPTRELAIQIAESVQNYGAHLKLRHTVIFGGVGQGRQVEALQRGVDILVATPGRLLDLMNQRHVRFDQIQVFVLDEADRMLDMGFINDVRKAAGPANLAVLRHDAARDRGSGSEAA
jgi:ATP-dependent RNA helicase RhlE